MASPAALGQIFDVTTSNTATTRNGSAEFGAPWGTAVRVISVVATFILVGASCIALMAVKMPLPAQIIIAVTPVLILIGAVAFMILGYRVEGETLIVKRPGWTTRIPLRGLKSANIDADAMKGAIRVVGNGGLFCFNGLFWSKHLRKFRVFATDLNSTVILRFADRVVVVSPDDPERFVKACRNLITEGPVPARA